MVSSTLINFPNPQTLHGRISLAMRLKGYSSEELARLTDLHVNTIRNIKIGAISDPQLSTIVKIANALEQSLDYFVYGITL